MNRNCKIHGITRHYYIPQEDRWRCNKCNYEGVKRRRHKVKTSLIELAGGKCALCGYSSCARALVFHHVSPASKSFNRNGSECARRSWDKVLKELDKCVLLCSNCHMEIEDLAG